MFCKYDLKVCDNGISAVITFWTLSIVLSLCKTCPEIGSSSIDWTQLSRSYLKTDTESSLRNVVLEDKQDDVLGKGKAMDNDQKRTKFNVHFALVKLTTLSYQFTRRVIKLTVVIIGGYHYYLLRTKFYRIFFSQG
jgi:hypothetical protein